MNLPEIADIAWGAHAPSRVVFGAVAKHFLRFRSPHGSSRRGRRLVQPRAAALLYKTMHDLWGMGRNGGLDCVPAPATIAQFKRRPSPSIFDHARPEIVMGTKLRIDATTLPTRNNILEMWSRLQRRRVPSRLLVWPDENHWILKGENSRVFYREVHQWLSQWLGQSSR